MNKVTAKYEVAFSHEILATEDIKVPARLKMGDQAEITIEPPELVDKNRLQTGRFNSLLRLDVTLDIDKKPGGQLLDVYFWDKCTSFLTAFILRLWITTGTDNIDPFQPPVFVKWSYFDSAGKEYINLETGKAKDEIHFPSWVGLTRVLWDRVIDDMVKGIPVAEERLWVLFAKRALTTNHHDQAVILAAIACELSIKRLADRLAKDKKVKKELWNYLVDAVRPRVRTYLQNIIPALDGQKLSKNDKKLFAGVERLFKYRNRLMHRGYQGRPREIHDYAPQGVAVAEQLLRWVENHP